MPLELKRGEIECPRAPEISQGAGETELLAAYLDFFSREDKPLRHSVSVPLFGTDAGFSVEGSLKVAVRAASIYLADREAYITVYVPPAPLSGAFTRELSEYIANRYYGGDGGLFERSYSRAGHSVDLAQNIAACAPMAAAPARIVKEKPAALEELLRRTDAGFSETLLRLIDESGKKDSEVYKRANIDRKLFSKIRSNPSYRPSKATALALAFALELDLDATRDLISRAGYSLTHSSRADIIVEYFIVTGNYDIFALNETLFAYDLPLLGGAS